MRFSAGFVFVVTAALARAAVDQAALHAPHPSGAYTIYTTSDEGDFTPLRFNPPAALRNSSAPSSSSDRHTGENPIWVTFGPKKDYVLDGSDKGLVFAVEADAQRKSNVRVTGNRQGYRTGGSGPVAACVVDDCLYVANYGSGSATVLQLDGQTGLPLDVKKPAARFAFQFSGPVTDRQDHSYAHQAVASPDGGWVYVADLGGDRIHHIKTPSSGQGCSSAAFDPSQSTVLQPGSGPRHIATFRDAASKKQYLYVCNELDGHVVAYRQSARSGKLTMIGEPVYGRPADVAPGGNSTAGPARTLAEIAVTHDGRFLYVSDRGDPQEDHVSLFARDPQTGAVQFVDYFAADGRNPRHFSLSHDERYLAVAHETSGNVAILKRDAISGRLSKTGAKLDIEGVNFAGFV